MSDSQAAAPPIPPHVQVIQIATGCWASRILYVAAKLGLADHLASGPKTAEAIAGPTGAHAPSLARVLRTLASMGLFMEDAEHRFSLTPLGESLKSGAPGAARATVLTLAGDTFWRGWEHVLYSVQTGKPGFDKALGEPIFDWLGKHPDEASLFSETMIGFHGMEPDAVVEAYDFSGFKTIVDVGGASGHLVTTVLAKHRGLRGILFDLPHVVKDAPALIAARGLADRITIESGSFFDGVPKGGDCYVLSHIIHDWSEAQCLAILGHCRRAMSPNGKVLVIETVLPLGNDPHPGKMLDMMMLVGPGGQERTEDEYKTLLSKAGFRLQRVKPTQSMVSVVEATPES